MKYLLMNNPDWNNAIEGIPLGVFEGNLEIWALYKNIKVYELNEKGIMVIGGVDEVGRGPLIGNVVAACVVLPVGFELEGLTDSKKLSEKKREMFYDIIMRDALAVGVGRADEKEIDEINISELQKERWQ